KLDDLRPRMDALTKAIKEASGSDESLDKQIQKLEAKEDDEMFLWSFLGGQGVKLEGDAAFYDGVEYFSGLQRFAAIDNVKALKDLKLYTPPLPGQPVDIVKVLKALQEWGKSHPF